MEKLSWKKAVLVLVVAAVARPGLAVFADSGTGSDSAVEPEQISVLTLSEEQRQCLAQSSAQTCFGTTVIASSDDPVRAPWTVPSSPPSTPVVSASGTPSDGNWFTNIFVGNNNPLGNQLDDARISFFSKAIHEDPTFFSGPVNVDFGVLVGGQRLYDDQVYADPDMRYTESNAKVPGVWMKHHIEIRPELNAGNSLLLPSLGFTTTKALGAGIAYDSSISLVKRHPLGGKVYTKNFWGYTKQDVRAMKDSLPTYFRLPFRYRDMAADYLPGEGIEIERYAAYSFYLGTNLLSVVHPATFALGWFLKSGVQFTKDSGHYKTILEMRQDGLIRLVLEKLADKSTELSIQAGPSIVAGPISTSVSVADAGMEWAQSHINVLDLILDLKDPKCERALLKAYSGDFRPAQELAIPPSETQTRDPSVASVTTVKIDSSATHKYAHFLFWGKESRETRANEISHTFGANSSVTEGHYKDDTMDKKVNSISDSYSTEVALRTDMLEENPALARRLSFQLNVNDSFVDRQDLSVILRVAQTFVPDENAEAFQKFSSEIEDGRSKGQVRINIDFNQNAVGMLLASGSTQADRDARYWTTWATMLGLSQPESWVGLSDAARRMKARAFNDDTFYNHYCNAHSFIDDMDKALRVSDVSDQARGLLSALHNLGDELYPIGVLVLMSDTQDIMGSFRITLKHQKTRTLSFLHVGSRYDPPSENLSAIYR